MRRLRVYRRRLDALDRRIAGLEEKKADSKKLPAAVRLDSALNVDSFWNSYKSSGWYEKRLQEINLCAMESSGEHSVAAALEQFNIDTKKSIRALHEALCVALAEGWIPHQPSPKQYRFLLIPDIEAFYGGAAGGGKSDALLMGAIMFCHLPGYHAILFRKTLEDHNLSGGLIRRSMEWLRGKARWDKQSHVWIFPSGATITFGYLNSRDDHLRYQSTEFQYVGFDEITHIPEYQSSYLFSRLRRLENQSHIPLRMRAAANPEGRYVQYVKRLYVDPETAIAPFVPARIEDNPGLDKASYLDSLARLDPIARERLQNGNWEILSQGLMFQRGWFEIVSNYPKDGRKVRFWDKAATAPEPGKDPDFTVGVLMTVKNGVYYVVDVERFRGTPRTNEEKILKIAKRDGVEVEIFMEQEPGSAGVADIANYARLLAGFRFRKGVRNTGSKEVRAGPFSSAAEHGNVKLVKSGWNRDFLDEIETFPMGYHDDQVDAASGAYSKLVESSPLGGSTVTRDWR
jgi:predicted phage terminase large subunit-like protein